MFSLLTALWALAVLAHQGYGEIVRLSPSMLLTLAAIALLLEPSSVPRLLLVVAAVFIDVGWYLPYVTNHWVLFALANLWLALGSGLLMWRLRRLPTGAEMYALHAPGLRVLAVLAYFFVMLAKLNSGFFHPEFGCAATMLGWITGKLHLPTPMPWMGTVGAWATILIEGGLPVLLCLQRTRLFAVVFGSAFHVVLGLNGFYNFSAVMLALYVPFLGDDFAERLRSVTRDEPILARLRAAWLRFSTSRFTLPVLWFLVLAAAFVPHLFGLETHRLGRLSTYSFLLLWLASEVVFVALVLRVWWSQRAGFGRLQHVGLGHPLALVPILLISLDGFAPYLGLKTEGSFTMFSNLRTEGELWNHLLLPRSMRVFDFQDDLVTIVQSSDPFLNGLDAQMVQFQLRSHLSTRPDVALEYSVAGTVRKVARAADDPNLAPVDRILGKLFWFKTVYDPDRNICTH